MVRWRDYKKGIRRIGSFCLRRAIPIVSLLVLGWLALCPWVRPPISKDIRGTQSTLRFATSENEEVGDPLLTASRRSEICLDTPGGCVFAVCAMGAFLILVSERCISVVISCIVAVLVFASCYSAIGYPVLYDSMEAEHVQNTNLKTLLGIASSEMFFVSSPPRPESFAPWHPSRVGHSEGYERRVSKWFGFPIQSSSVLVGVSYQRASLLIVIVGFLVFAVAASQNKTIRFGHLAWAILFGGTLSFAFLWTPLQGMRLRQKAIELTSRFELEKADLTLQDALETCPSLKRCRLTLMAQGELDHLHHAETSEAILYQADHYYRRRELREAINELAKVNATDPNRWYADEILAEVHVLRGVAALQSGVPQSAEKSFANAVAISSQRIDALVGLCIAENLTEKGTAREIVARLDPWINEVASATLKSDLYSICGKAFELESDHDSARKYFRLAYDIIRMPRHVSHFAEEGLLGF